MGNPAESGTHLLYYFRQVNNINKDLFIDQSKVDLSDTQIKRYIYIDDMSITGKQVYLYILTYDFCIIFYRIFLPFPCTLDYSHHLKNI
jgi:hypothetical protein